jgi:hypothetical protein
VSKREPDLIGDRGALNRRGILGLFGTGAAAAVLPKPVLAMPAPPAVSGFGLAVAKEEGQAIAVNRRPDLACRDAFKAELYVGGKRLKDIDQKVAHAEGKGLRVLSSRVERFGRSRVETGGD